MSVSKSLPSAENDEIITIDRRRAERRGKDTDSPDSQPTSGNGPKTPRRKKHRRRHIDPTTCEREYNSEEIEFMRAMDDYKRDSGRMFPTCSEVLEVIRALGYVKLTSDQPARWQPLESDHPAGHEGAAVGPGAVEPSADGEPANESMRV
jgi:hypothetical protein